MTLKDFQNRYYMHDSYFKEITYDRSNSTVTMLINFAYWMQEWYKESEPENAILKCTFTDVSVYDQSWKDIDCKTLGILQTEVIDNTIKFALDDINDEYHELRITAESVETQEYFNN